MIVIASAAAVVLAATTLASSAAVSARPTLLIVEVDPTVTVAGNHFRAGERVRVTLRTDVASRARWVRSSRRGSFYADIGALPQGFKQCKDTFSVVARGTTGDRAVVRYVTRECPPPPG